jgi:Na+/serine symporter
MGKLSPIGLSSPLFGAIISINDFNTVLKDIRIFAAVVVVTWLFYSLCLKSLLVFLFTRTNPYKYFPMFLDAIVTTFIAANSAISVNTGIEICEKKAKIDPSIGL